MGGSAGHADLLAERPLAARHERGGTQLNDYSIDPKGSISIIDMRRGAPGLRQSDLRTADFAAFDNAPLDPSIRILVRALHTYRTHPAPAQAKHVADRPPEHRDRRLGQHTLQRRSAGPDLLRQPKRQAASGESATRSAARPTICEIKARGARVTIIPSIY